jgi:hypothetical protein
VEWEDVVDVSSGTEWTRLQITFTVPTGEGGTYRLLLADKNTPGNAYYDGIQVEEGAEPTSYCDGSLDWCSWTGTEHGSTSIRSDTNVTANGLTDLVSKSGISYRFVVQAPADHDDMIAGRNVITELDGTNRLLLNYEGDTNRLRVYDGTDWPLSQSVTFSENDWLDIVLTCDGSSWTLYLDGEQIAAGTANTPNWDEPNFSAWGIGHNGSGSTWWGDWAFAEIAVFDSILTAEEVAALHQRNAPLVDTGAYNTPGIYILDGRVRLASSLDADRMEFTADELAVYESGNKELWIDIDGFSLRQGDGTLNSIKWYDSSGEGIGQMYASWGGTSSDLVLTVIQAFNSGVSGSASGIMLNAEDTGEDRRLYVMSDGRLSGTSINYFSLENGGTKWVEFDEDGDLSLILGDQGGGDSFRVKDSGSTTRFEVDSSGKVYTYGDVRVGQGLHVGDTSSDPGDGDITCNGTIATNSGEEWNLGGTASGTVSPDTKIHVKIDGSWYTLQAEAGLK